ncbi:MAG: AAA family ATPase [Clostridia bacterium]|nr:AAA family ATPase [Clostridia bacterium]
MMFIEKMHIDTFGKLSDFDLELSPGMNIIEGANESGKSTLAAFIKFVLYGVNSREREQLLSWRTGGAAGSLTVCVDSHRYRIERAMVGSREAVQLIDGENNMPIRGLLDGTTPGELFLGVDAEMFAATAFVSQVGGMSAGGSKVSEGIENILFSADENVNTQRAIAKLDAARASLLHKNEKGGRLFELDTECAELEVKLADALRVHEDILSKEAQLADSREKQESAAARALELGGKIKQFEVNALLELFGRKRVIEARMSALHEQLETANAQDLAVLEKMDGYEKKHSLLKRELDEIAARSREQRQTEPDPELDEYIKLGGREALEAKMESCRVKSKAYVAVGIVALLFGLAEMAFGLRPMMTGGTPHTALAAVGGVLAALAVTLFILSLRARKRAEDIELYYDFDALECAADDLKAARETAKFTSLALSDANRRYDELCEEIKRECGCGADELAARCAEQTVKMRESNGLKSEYDKYATLLSQMNTQLGAYNEDELREMIDEGADMSDIDIDNLSEMRREADFASKMASSLEKHCGELEKTLAGLYPVSEDPKSLADKLAARKSERCTLQKKHAAYKLAYEKLCEASESLRRSVAPRLAADAAQNMAYITDGKYRELGVGADLSMSAETESGQRTLDVLSAGTQDAAYLCLRLALISLLYRKSEPPMIYDESFIRQDDVRLTNLLRLISVQKSQSLIFTSNDREPTLMRKLSEFKHIKL